MDRKKNMLCLDFENIYHNFNFGLAQSFFLSWTLCLTNFFSAQIYGTAFLGATDVDLEGTWVWIDGSAWDYDRWASEEPSGGAGENCLEMVPTSGGTWNDVPCDASHTEKAFVCAYDNGMWVSFCTIVSFLLRKLKCLVHCRWIFLLLVGILTNCWKANAELQFF